MLLIKRNRLLTAGACAAMYSDTVLDAVKSTDLSYLIEQAAWDDVGTFSSIKKY